MTQRPICSNFDRHVRRQSWAAFKNNSKSIVFALVFIFSNLPSIQSAHAAICPDLSTITNISGVVQWLRADCVNGVAEDPVDGTSIATWSDLSGNNNNATTSSTAPTFESDALKLINGNPVVNFPNGRPLRGIDIRATSVPNISIFAVYKVTASDNRDGVWGNDDGGWDRFFLATWNGNNGIISAGGPVDVANSAVIGSPTLITTVLQYGVSSGSKVYRNGEVAATLTDGSSLTGAHNPSFIGSGGNGLEFNGDIAEIIIFNRALTSTELLTVNGYLNTKYALNMSAQYLPETPTASSISVSVSAGNLYFRTTKSISAVASVAGKVTFRANGRIIPGCKNLTVNAGNSLTRSCSFRPSGRGYVTITTTLTPTSSSFTGSVAATSRLFVYPRSGGR